MSKRIRPIRQCAVPAVLASLLMLSVLWLPVRDGTASLTGMFQPVPTRAGTVDPRTPTLGVKDSEPIVFFATAFPREREIVRQFYAEDISNAERMTPKDAFGGTILLDGVPVTDGRVTILVAPVNLNSDGRADITFLVHTQLCARNGCRFVLLIATPNSKWINGLGYDVIDDHAEANTSIGAPDPGF